VRIVQIEQMQSDSTMQKLWTL